MPRFDVVEGDSTVRVVASSSLHPIEVEAGSMSGFLDIDLADDRIRDSPVSGRLVVPVKDLRSGMDVLDRETERRLDVRRHPTIVAELKTLDAMEEPGRYRAAGTVSFHGVTRDAHGALTIEPQDGGRLRVAGVQTFDVRDFGVKPPRLLVLRVHPDVEVSIDLSVQANG